VKLAAHFDTFLDEVVNLNATRVQQLEDSIAAIKDVIRASDWAPKVKSYAAQGSWAHKTIIKPVKDAPFDADLLAFVEPEPGWEAKTYIDELYRVFTEHGTYKDKVRRFSHCVTIEYAGERKIDVAPCVIDRGGTTKLEVCNRTTNEFELSEPRKYTAWLIERNGWTGGNGLRKVTRLVKYLRDIKTTFTCPSVLLTTILGERISEDDDANTDDFCDVPTALKTIFGRLDDWLQDNASTPVVCNPVLSSETLSDAWDDDRYRNFRDKVHKYREWVDDAYDEADHDESIGKWRRVFGEEFAKSASVEKAARATHEIVEYAKSAGIAPVEFKGDEVSLFERLGARILPAWFNRIAHKQRPKWRILTPPAFTVQVKSTLHSARRGGVWEDMITPLPKDHWIQLRVATQMGIPLPDGHDVYWRVTNTGGAAFQAGQMRGEILKANDGSSHWEHLSYRGIHTVEAFVLRKRDNVIVAQSAPYYVVIA